MRMPPRLSGIPATVAAITSASAMGVAAHLVLAAVDLAAQRGALQQDVFQAKAEAFLGHVLAARGSSSCAFSTRNAHSSAACTPSARFTWVPPVRADPSLQGHRTPRIRRRSGVTSPRASMASRMVLLIVLTGR